MKYSKFYLIGFITLLSFLSFSSIFLETKIITNKQDDQGNKNVVSPLTAESPFVCEWYRMWSGQTHSPWENYIDYGRDVALDSLGNIYIVGAMTPKYHPYTDILILKYDSTGTLVMEYSGGLANWDDEGVAVAVDSSDYVYMTGYIEGRGAGGRDMILKKFKNDPWGEQEYLWGGEYNDLGTGVAVDSLDNVYVAGSTASFGDGSEMFLIKYNEYGIKQWNYTWGGASWDWGNGVAIDSSNNVYLVGTTGDYYGNLDIALIKYDSNGIQQWNCTWNGSNDEYGCEVAIDSSDNVYLVGYTKPFGVGNYEMVLVKYDGNGVQQWNCTWGGAFDDYGYGVTVDSLNNVYITGKYDSASLLALVKYNENGVLQWNRTWSIWYYGTEGRGIAIDSSDHLFVAGTYYNEDVVLAKFGPDIYDPMINVSNPEQNKAFGMNAPEFDISIIEPNLDSTWYTIDNGVTNITFDGLTGTINQTEWSKKSDYEEITLTFYVNDTEGHIGSKSVIIWKDAVAPKITIHSPIANEKFGNNAPNFNISIIEEDLDSAWYTIEGVSGNFNITELNGIINQDVWTDLPQGDIMITFYAQDRAGNIDSESVVITKSIPSKQEIPGYNILLLLGILTVASIFMKKVIKIS
jgi:uncharacterized delta-60 repeat protein